MQGISGIDASSDEQTGQDLLRNGNLVGFLVYAHLRQDFLCVVGTEGKQMWSFLLP
jgi:hypothetical protein